MEGGRTPGRQEDPDTSFLPHPKDETFPPFHRCVDGGATVWNSVVHHLLNASINLLSKEMIYFSPSSPSAWKVQQTPTG